MERLDRFRQNLSENGFDGALISQPENRRYLAGFTGSNALLLVTHTQLHLFTDSRYAVQAKEQCQGWTVHIVSGSDAKATLIGLCESLSTLGPCRLGFEANYVTYAEGTEWVQLQNQVPGLEMIPMEDYVIRQRAVKDAKEIEAIQAAAAIADGAFRHTLDKIRPGMTEMDVALELETHMRKQGATGPSFATIVASGVRSALPHGVASAKVLETGDFVTMDFGAVYDGYVSDLTRTICLGTPSDVQREIYGIVLEAQTHALASARIGMTGKALDAVARNLIEAKGYGQAFGHSLGHGIGLNIHEEPRISKASDDVLCSGMVITIEPGIYLPNVGGVRIEDDLLLSEAGNQVLTHAPKELICV